MRRPAITTALTLDGILAVATLMTAIIGITGIVPQSAVDHVSLQISMNELAAKLAAADRDGDRDSVNRILREMASLDREHPKIFSQIADSAAKTKAYDQAAELMDSIGSTGPGRVFGRAILEYRHSESAAAEASFREAIEGYDRLEHLAGLAYGYGWLVWPLSGQKKFDEADIAADRAYDLFLRLKDPVRAADTLAGSAKIAKGRGEFDKALALYRRGLETVEREDNLDKQVKFWNLIGGTLRAKGRYSEAVKSFRRALELQDEMGDRRGRYGSLLDIARCYRDDDRQEQARTHYLLALEANTEERGEQGNAEGRYAMAYEWTMHHGDTLKAVEEFRDVLAFFRKPPQTKRNRSYELSTMVHLSSALIQLGRFSEARDVLEPALKLARERRHKAWQAACLTNLANVGMAEGRFTQALLDQQAALEINRERGDSEKILLCLTNLGAIHHALGDVELTQRYVTELLDLAREKQDQRSHAHALSNLGVLLVDAGKPSEALALEREALALWESIGDARRIANNDLLRANILWKLDRRDEAVSAAELALAGYRKVRDADGQATTLNDLAGFSRDSGTRPNRDKALRLYTEALALASERGIQEETWMAYAGRAETLAALGRHERARQDYQRAIAVIEQQRARQDTGEFKVRVFARKADIFDKAIGVALKVDKGVSVEAFELAERSRARGLLELLAESSEALRDSIPPELARTESELRDVVTAAATRLAKAETDQEMNSAREGLSTAEDELRRFEIELRRSVPRYAELSYPRAIRIQDIQSDVLQANETLLSYYLGDTDSLLWAITREGVTQQVLPPRSTIDGLVRSFLERAGRSSPSVGGRKAGRTEAEALAKALLPIDLPRGRRLLVALDGPLHHLPFDALFRDGRYLVEDHEVVVVPSATTLALMRENPATPAAGSFLGVGAPEFTSEKYPALPHSRQALQHIAGLFPEAERTVLTGAAASRQALMNLELERFSHIHFATHGWLDPVDPSRSGLLLSRPSEDAESELLFVEDVFALRMAPQLVVLASCQSGSGELLRGEGLVSMSRAFLYAGARSLVVSLWNVNDRSTAEFMTAFYGRLVSGMEAPAALRQTKLEFIHSDRPAQRQAYRWAPFVFIGEGSSLGLQRAK